MCDDGTVTSVISKYKNAYPFFWKFCTQCILNTFMVSMTL